MIIVWNGMKGCMAFATFGFVFEQGLEKPVLYAAFRALDDQGFWLQNGLAFPTNGVISQSVSGDAILCAAARASDDCAILTHAFSHVLHTELTVSLTLCLCAVT